MFQLIRVIKCELYELAQTKKDRWVICVPDITWKMPLIKYGLKGNLKKFQVLYFYLKNSVKYKLKKKKSKHEQPKQGIRGTAAVLELTYRIYLLINAIFLAQIRTYFPLLLKFISIIFQTLNCLNCFIAKTLKSYFLDFLNIGAVRSARM